MSRDGITTNSLPGRKLKPGSMAYSRLVFRVHAIQRMFTWGVSDRDVRQVVTNGEVIREYPDDKPYPSRLLLGYVRSRPLHVVAADNDAKQETVIITVYEPDPALWEPDFKRKRR